MSNFLSTVEEYEGKVLELVEGTKSPVVDYVSKGVELVGDRVPAITYPEFLPNPIELVQSQAAFAKKLIDANTAIVTAVLETVAPVAGFAKPKKAAKPAVKAA
jgi:hypothetical protein